MFQPQDIVLRNLKKLLYLIWLLHFFHSPLPLPAFPRPLPPVATLREQEAQLRLPPLCTSVCRLPVVSYVLFHSVDCTNNKPFTQL